MTAISGGVISRMSCVVVGGFLLAPAPGKDVVTGCCDEETAAVEVGSVEKDLIVDGVVVWLGHADQPQWLEVAVNCFRGCATSSGDVGDAFIARQVGDELIHPGSSGDIGPGFTCRGTAVDTTPSCGAFCCCAVFLCGVTADTAAGTIG
ncbi:hypothetical protein CCHOA_01385 [Corynebacterium choanae]|uniref:Uncharacterized protein n=1 Tax=Corynebacterium choanae TaxID=1862358 RepID=A0A3G6J3R0_9CORY|nr:hypothetical protein CCHOA_01385 [Corynebacterium choanae]